MEERDVKDMEERMASRFLGLDMPVTDDGSPLHEMLPAPEAEEDLLGEMADSEVLQSAMESLDERSRTIVEERWFHGATLQTLSQRFGVSMERIRQIEVKALQTLRKGLEKHLQ